MKSIAHIVSTGEFSGAEKIVIEICKCLKNDYEFTYICKYGGIIDYLEKNHIKYILYRNTSELINLLRNNDFDLIHAHDYTASVLSGFFFKGRIISHIHNNTPFARTLNLKSIIYFLSTRRVEKILCVSNSIINEMYFKNRLKNKLEVVYNWVNKDERYWNDDAEKNTDILFVGRFTEQKNPMFFLEVVNQLINDGFMDIKVKIIGRGELREDILHYINKNKLNKSIEVLDFTDKPHKYMKESKIFFVPSKWEGFGLVFLEAMINDCAVVATPVGGIKEIFCDDLSNFSTDKNELVKNIKKILSDDEYRMKIVSKNKKILERFDMIKNTNILKEYYK